MVRIYITPATVTRDPPGYGKIVDIKVHQKDIIKERNINKAIFAIRRLIEQQKSFGVEIYDY